MLSFVTTYFHQASCASSSWIIARQSNVTNKSGALSTSSDAIYIPIQNCHRFIEPIICSFFINNIESSFFNAFEKYKFLAINGCDYRNMSTIRHSVKIATKCIPETVRVFGLSLNLMPHHSAFTYRGIDKTPETRIIDRRGASGGDGQTRRDSRIQQTRTYASMYGNICKIDAGK